MNQSQAASLAIHVACIVVLVGIWLFLLAMGRIRYLRSRDNGDSGPWPPVVLAMTLLAPLIAIHWIAHPYPSDAMGAACLLAGAAIYMRIVFSGQCHACNRTYWTVREEPHRCPHCNRELW